MDHTTVPTFAITNVKKLSFRRIRYVRLMSLQIRLSVVWVGAPYSKSEG